MCFSLMWIKSLIQCSSCCSLREQTRQIEIIFSNHRLSCLRLGSVLPARLIRPRSAGPRTGSPSFWIRALIASARLTSGFRAGCRSVWSGLGLVRLDSLHAGRTTCLIRRHGEGMARVCQPLRFSELRRLTGLICFGICISGAGLHVTAFE